MWLFLLALTTVITLISSCTTPPKEILPPKKAEYFPPNLDFVGDKDRESLDLQLLSIATKFPDQSVQWWVNYRRARLWENDQPGTACLLYRDLSQNPLFPIHQIALLRAYSSCEKGDLAQLKLEAMNPRLFPEWIQPLSIDIALKNSRRDGLSQENFTWAYEKSKFSLPYSEKVLLTQEALRFATILNDQSKIKLAQERLYRIAPRFKPSPKPETFLDIAYDYRRVREFPKARKFYQKILARRQTSFQDNVKAFNGIRMTYKIEGNKPKYLAATLNMAHFVEHYWRQQAHPSWSLTHQYHNTQLTVARTYWTLGQPTPAQNILKNLAKKIRGQHPLDEIFWLRGRMAEERGHYDEATQWFQKGISELKSSQKESLERLQWYLAWNLRKIHRSQEAQNLLLTLRDHSDNDFARSRYTFWLAITYKDQGKSEDTLKTLQLLVQEDPLGYYGLLAHRELQIPVSIAHLSSPAKKNSPNTADFSLPEQVLEPAFIEWLISVGEKKVANLYLDQVSANYRKRQDQQELGWVQLFHYYARSGIYLSLYNQMSMLEPSLRTSVLNDFPDLVFPTPYEEFVSSAANRYGVSSELIYSIMRQESAFDPGARSPADAFGLMQLLPEVAQRTAKQINFDFKTAEDLYEPHINIPLGSAFLRELWDKFNGQFILTVASYNASEEAIFGWLRTRFRGDTLEFIEDIPYEETRSYVRLVMRNLVYYSLMSSGGKAIPFPEWTLALSAPSSLGAQ